MNMQQPNFYQQQQVPHYVPPNGYGVPYMGMSVPAPDPTITHQQQMYQNQLYQQQLFQNQMYQQQAVPSQNFYKQQPHQQQFQQTPQPLASSSFRLQQSPDFRYVEQQPELQKSQVEALKANQNQQQEQVRQQKNQESQQKQSTKTIGVQRGKGRSLEEILKRQISEGKVDPNEKIIDSSNRYYRRQESGGERRNTWQRQQSDGRNNSNGEGGDADSGSLNWQQQELLNGDKRKYNGNWSNGSQGFGGNQRKWNSNEYLNKQRYNSTGRSSRGNGYQQRNSYQQSYNGFRNSGSQRAGNNKLHLGNSYQNSSKPKDYDNNPEWADDVVGSGAVNEDSLNWQQQGLVNRDESDPFNRFVRGENELIRE